MTRIPFHAVALTGLLAALPAAAQQTTGTGTGTGTAQEVPDPAVQAAVSAGITCQCNGYEVVLHHDGTAVLPEGTVIGWNVPFARMDGTHTLTRPFEPGGMVALSAVLGSSYVSPSKPCVVSLP